MLRTLILAALLAVALAVEHARAAPIGPGASAGSASAGEVPPESVVAATPAGAEGSNEEPLTESGVVQLLAAGHSEAEIVARISARRVAFDLSTEMLDELRRAGVSEPLIAAMQRRQREMAPPAPTKPVSQTSPGFVALAVRLRSDDASGPAALFFPATAWDELSIKLALGPHAADRRVNDLAIYLACLAPNHVPGLWRTSSPLGRDFVSIPPHQLLAFQAGAKPVGAQDVPERIVHAFDQRNGKAPAPAEWLRLDFPATVTGEIEASAVHDLLLGVAARFGDRYLGLGSGRVKDFTATADATLEGSIRQDGTRGDPFAVNLGAPKGGS